MDIYDEYRVPYRDHVVDEFNQDEMAVLEDILPAKDQRKTVIDWTHYCTRCYWLWEGGVKAYLEADGWHNIRFYDGERDSFGPLSRIMTGRDPAGSYRRFIYG